MTKAGPIDIVFAPDGAPAGYAEHAVAAELHDQPVVSWGVMSTPALVIDDEVVLSGRIPSPDQLEQLLADAR